MYHISNKNSFFVLPFIFPSKTTVEQWWPPMQQVSRLFFLLMIDDTTETPTFLTPFLSVNSFQLLWKTCVRWCAWNRVFVSIATLQLLASCLYSTKKRRAQGKLWDRRHQAAGQRRALVPLVNSSSNSVDDSCWHVKHY